MEPEIQEIPISQFIQSTTQTEKYFCFNPSCRIFGLRWMEKSSADLHVDCKKWILSKTQLQSNLYPCPYSLRQNTEFDFKKVPLQSLFAVSSIIAPIEKNPFDQSMESLGEEVADPLLILKINFNQIRIRIQNELEKAYHEIENRILGVKQISSKAMRQIQNILFIKKDRLSSHVTQNYQSLKQFAEFAEVVGVLQIQNQEKIARELQKISISIDKIGKSFWNSEPDSLKRQKDLFEKIKKDLEDFIHDNAINACKKLQTLSNLYQTKNIEPVVSPNKLEVSVKCWVCEQLFIGRNNSTKENRIKSCTDLVNHVLNTHEAETKLKFIEKSMKLASIKISFKQFLSQIQQRNYTRFIIRDRQNQSKNTLLMPYDKINEETFLLDVVSKRTENLAVGKYIVAESQTKDAADILMVMLMLSIIMEHRQKVDITLITKDHFAEGFRDIVKNQFGLDITIKN